MTRDYKPASVRQQAIGKGSVFFTGFLFGLITGISASVVVALLIEGGDSPFFMPERAPHIEATPATGTEGTTQPADDPSHFDFYNILPSNEKPILEQPADPPAAPATQQAPVEMYYLQVGAFQSEQDADNLKAQLALLGMEVVVQTVEVAGQGNLHRVRVGPYANLEQISRARTLLAQNAFDAELVKVHNASPHQ